MAKTIDLVFGVKGASVGGASGRTIISQLKTLAAKISDDTSKIPKVKFGVNEKSTRAEIQKQLTRISKDIKVAPLSVNVNLKTGSSPNGKLSDKSLSQLYGAQEKSLKRIYSLRTKLANKKISSGESAELKKQLSLEKENYNTINKQIATFGTLHNKAQRRQQLTSQTLALESKLSQEKARQVRLSEEQSKSSLEQLQTQLQDVNNKIVANAYGSESDRLGLKNADPADVDAYILKISKLKSEIEQALKNPVTSKNATYIEDLINQYENLINVERKALIQSGKVTQSNNSVQLSYIKLANNISDYITKHEASLKVKAPQEYQTLLTLQQQLRDNIYKGTPNSAKKIFEEMQISAREAGGEVETLGQKIKRVFGEKLGYGIIASAAMMLRQVVKQVYTNVVELDKAVVDLQIATGKSREKAKELVDTYSDLGRELGATTKEVANAADTWLRQGYNIEDANELIKQSTMLSKLGQMESAEASTALTSSLKGYQLAASDAASVVDKLTAVDMEAAASAGDIATAMSECANSARIAGVDMNTLIGYLTTVKEVTQDSSESVGTFAKTMFARMGNIKAGNLSDPETGEDLSDVESALSAVDIKLRSANNQFRDFDDVLSEVAADWDNYSNVQQHAIAVAFAGTRQQEKFLVLMENYGDAMEYAGVSTESAGTALNKYTNSYLPSVQAAQDSFTASFEQFSQAFLDSDLVAGVIRFGDGFMQILTGIVKFLSFGDGLVGQLALITAGLWALNAAMVAFNTQTGIFASTGEPIEALTYHAREYSGGDTERVNKIIVLFTREYLEKPTSLGLIA